MAPKVSIIFPVYNVSFYLDAALESIANQSLTDFEVIAVNDGSTDHSSAILNKWKENSPLSGRLKVINQENGGLSSARNTGLRQACGQYIFFMDSDDCIHPDLLKMCYEMAEKDQLDLIQFEHQMMSHEGELLEEYSTPVPLENGVYQLDSYLNKLYERGKRNVLAIVLAKYHMTVWSYFIRHSIIVEGNLSFYPGIIHEDELFTPQLYYYTNKIGYLNKPLYYYRISENSITHSSDDILTIKRRRSDSLRIIIRQLLKFSHSHGENSDFNRFISSRIKELFSIYIYMPFLQGNC